MTLPNLFLSPGDMVDAQLTLSGKLKNQIERWHRKSKNQPLRKRELKLNLAESEKSMWHPWHYLKGHLVQRCSIYDLTLNTLVRT